MTKQTAYALAIGIVLASLSIRIVINYETGEIPRGSEDLSQTMAHIGRRLAFTQKRAPASSKHSLYVDTSGNAFVSLAHMEERARRVFGNSRTGEALAVVATYAGIAGFGEENGRRFGNAVSYLKSHPDDAIGLLKKALPELPNEYEDGRRYLLQLAARFDVPAESRIELLSADLKRYQSPKVASTASAFGPSLTFDALMDVTSDVKFLESEIRPVLLALRETEAGFTLLSRFSARYPSEAEAIGFDLDYPIVW